MRIKQELRHYYAKQGRGIRFVEKAIKSDLNRIRRNMLPQGWSPRGIYRALREDVSLIGAMMWGCTPEGDSY